MSQKLFKRFWKPSRTTKGVSLGRVDGIKRKVARNQTISLVPFSGG